jgi:hypothetical protein
MQLEMKYTGSGNQELFLSDELKRKQNPILRRGFFSFVYLESWKRSPRMDDTIYCQLWSFNQSSCSADLVYVIEITRLKTNDSFSLHLTTLYTTSSFFPRSIILLRIHVIQPQVNHVSHGKTLFSSSRDIVHLHSFPWILWLSSRVFKEQRCITILSFDSCQ